MNKKLIGAGVAVIIFLVILGFVRSSKLPAQKNTFTIGAPLILSGEFAKYGESSKRAIDIAVDEYNAHEEVITGKWPIVKVIYEDTHADPKTAVSAYQKLVSFDHVNAIVGPLLQVEMAAIAPLVTQNNTPVFSVAPIPQEARGKTSNPLVIWPDPTLEAEQMAQYVYDHGARTVGILSTKDAWESEVSNAFQNRFVSLGGKIVSHEVVLPDSKDISLPVTKVMATHPDAVFVGTYYKFIYFVRKLKELGYAGKLYSIEIDSYLSGETKPFSNSLEFISPAFYTDDFTKKFNDRYGDAPSIPSGQAHDAMAILLSMIPHGNILRDMENLKEFNGVSGKILFSAEHRATFPISMFKIQDGKIVSAQ